MRASVAPISSVIAVALLVAGCMSTNYRDITASSVPVGQMLVSLGDGWVRAPEAETPEKLSAARTFSRSDLSRDRLMMIPGINNGKTIFRNQQNGLPAFRLEMNNQQIADMVGESLQQTLWGGNSTVTVSRVREHGYLGKPGFMFDIEIEVPGGANRKGLAGGFVHEEALYLNIFTAEAPGHFNQHREAARQAIESATVRIRTIRPA